MEILSPAKKINVRGTINSLEIGDLPIRLLKKEYKISSIRSIAGSLTTETGKKFSVSIVDDEVIVITRIA
jgi:hypothetical protein